MQLGTDENLLILLHGLGTVLLLPRVVKTVVDDKGGDICNDGYMIGNEQDKLMSLIPMWISCTPYRPILTPVHRTKGTHRHRRWR